MNDTNHEENLNETDETLAENTAGESQSADEYSTEEITRQKFDELNDKHMRLYAEFENFRKRTLKERFELRDVISKEILLAFLPVYDDLNRALESAQKSGESSAMLEGFNLIHGKFKHILTLAGVTPMDATGKEFNSDIYDAITTIPTPSPELKGKVIDEIEKGYMINDKVLRFAKVVVGE